MLTSEEYAARLPDTYAKDGGSNNEKLLGLNESLLADGYADVADTEKMVGLDLAFGATLDLYGEMVGQPRGGMDDTQYRYLIRNRTSRNFVAGDYESVLDGIVAMFEADKSTIVLDDDPAESGVVHVTRLPFNVLNAAGLTAKQAVEMIQQLVPAGVRVDAENFEGTFETAAATGDYDEDKGYAISDEDQSIGGYLGLVFGEEEEPPLPIE